MRLPANTTGPLGLSPVRGDETHGAMPHRVGLTATDASPPRASALGVRGGLHWRFLESVESGE
jgi:hypothetical protein